MSFHPSSGRGKSQMVSREHATGISKDEKRLFPSYGSNSNEVRITPGATFHPIRLQEFARLRPVNCLSGSNIRDSGPVRARGKPRQSVKYDTNSKNYEASLKTRPSYRESADIEELAARPVKRRRREDSVINLADTESAASSPVDRHPSSLSPTSSQLSIRANKKGPPAQLYEFREVERVMRHRPQNKPKPNKQRRPSFDDDDMDENSYTRNAARQQGCSIELLSDSEQPVHTPKQKILRSVEIHHPRRTLHEDNLAQTPPLQMQYVAVGGRRRTPEARESIDARESPDELQGEATVQPAPKSLDRSRKTNVSSPVVAHQMEAAAHDEDWTTTRIWQTLHPKRQERGRPSRKSTGSAKGSRHKFLFEATSFRFGAVERLSSEGKPFEIHIDSGNGTIGLAEENADLENASTVSLRKVREVLRGMDNSHKVRLNLSSSEGTARQMDIELSTVEEKEKLCSLFVRQDVKVQNKPSEWMDKSFKRNKNEKFAARYSNGSKRPSSESAPGPISESKVEVAKRPKLSDSLQDSPGNTTVQPAPMSNRTPRDSTKSSAAADRPKEASDPNSHSHPPRTDLDDGIEIQVKKFTQGPSHARETRSTTRRALSPVVCDDDDDDDNHQSKDDKSKPQLKSNAKYGNHKWQKPLVYPRLGKKRAEIDSKDRERLRDDEFLNDNLIGFYIRFLEDHLARTNQEVAKQVYFFNSYFFATLTNLPKGKRGINYEAVQKWTRNVDIFSHDYIVVPINESAHWYVAIICNLRNLLQAPEGSSEIVDTTTVENEPSTQARSEIQEIQEIPETPEPEVPAAESAGAPDQDSLPEKEEVARQSLASMSLSEKAETADNGNKDEIPATDEDRPDGGENRNSPATVAHPRDSSNQKDSKEQHEPGSSSQKSRKSKKKGRASRADDPSQPTIITFDSLDLTRQPTIRALKDYLYEEAKSKRAVEIDTSLIRGMKARDIPLQPNYSDCGLYLLAYVEKFAQSPDAFIGKLLRREMNLKVDWPVLRSGLLRRRLGKFLDDIYDEQERISRDEGSEESTLADRKPISFLLGCHEPSRVEGGGEANAEVRQSGNAAEAEAPPEKPNSATEDPQKQVTQEESSLEEQSTTADPPKEATTDASDYPSIKESDNTAHDIRSEAERSSSTVLPGCSSANRVSDLEIIEVTDSQENGQLQLQLQSELSSSPNLDRSKTKSRPDTNVVDMEEKPSDAKEAATTLEDGGVAVSENGPNREDATEGDKPEVYIPGTPPPSAIAQDTVRRSPRYSKHEDETVVL